MSEPAADAKLAEHLLGTVLRPRATFEALARQTSARPGAAAVAVLGIAWTALCLLLWSAGHAPRFVLIPVPGDDYYLLQGLLTLPIVTGLWWLFSEIAHRIARARGGVGTEGATRAALGFAYATPLTLHVGAELAGFAIGGVEALTRVARVSMPVATLWTWALCALALRVGHRVSPGVAIGASFAALLVQAIAGALVLR